MCAKRVCVQRGCVCKEGVCAKRVCVQRGCLCLKVIQLKKMEDEESIYYQILNPT